MIEWQTAVFPTNLGERMGETAVFAVRVQRILGINEWGETAIRS